MAEPGKVATREKLFYGVGDLGFNVAYGAVSFYTVFFLTDVAGLPPAWAGYIFMIARIWDAIVDPVIGVLCDRTRSRHGRRRPYLLYGAVPFGIAFALMWVVPSSDPALLFAYYTAVTILFNTSFALVGMPYNALLPELTQNYDERTSITGYRIGLSFIGTLLAAAGIMVIVDVVFPGRSEYRTSFPVMGCILAAIMILCTLLVFAGTKERVGAPPGQSPGRFLQSMKSFVRMKQFRVVLGMFLFNMIGFDVITAINVYFLKYVVRMGDDITYVFMAIPLIIAAAITPLWVAVSKRWGKQLAYKAAVLYFLLPLLLCLFIPAGNIPFAVAIVVLMGVGISAAQVLPYSMLPDFIEYDEYANGVRREGAFYGVVMFIYKLASAAAVATVSISLGWFGYIESASGETVTQPAFAVFGIRVLMGVLPAVFFLLSAFFVSRITTNKAAFEQIKQAITERT